MAELFRRGLRLGPPGSEQVRGGRRRSPPNSISPRNKKFRRGIRRGLGGLPRNKFVPRRIRSDPRRIGGTSAGGMHWKGSARVRHKDIPRVSAADFWKISSSRNYSATDDGAAEPFRGKQPCRGTIPRLTTVPRTYSANASKWASNHAVTAYNNYY